jgi:hypothetical protein
MTQRRRTLNIRCTRPSAYIGVERGGALKSPQKQICVEAQATACCMLMLRDSAGVLFLDSIERASTSSSAQYVQPSNRYSCRNVPIQS